MDGTGLDFEEIEYYGFSWLRSDNYFDGLFDDEEFGFVRNQDVDSCTLAQREAITKKCRQQGKEDPWTYRARKDQERRTQMIQQQNYTEKKEKREADAELPSVKKVSNEFKIALQQARQAAGLKQKDVAAKLKVNVNMVAGWESGKSFPSGVQRNLLNRVLGTTLPKP